MSLKEPYNILYIDGNDVRKKQTSSRLRMQSFDVEIAQGGFHSIYIAEKVKFDLIIAQGDELEDMPTSEVVSLLRNIYPKTDLPILAILMEEDDETASHLVECGVNEIVINNGNFNIILKEIEKIQKAFSKRK